MSKGTRRGYAEALEVAVLLCRTVTSWPSQTPLQRQALAVAVAGLSSDREVFLVGGDRIAQAQAEDCQRRLHAAGRQGAGPRSG